MDKLLATLSELIKIYRDITLNSCYSTENESENEFYQSEPCRALTAEYHQNNNK